MKVSEIMTKNPVTVKQTDTLGAVVRLLSAHKISGVPVVSRGRLVGVVTQTDVIGAVDVYKKINKNNVSFDTILGLLGSNDRKVKQSITKMLQSKVGDLKKKKVVSIDSDDEIYKSAVLINMHSVDRLPVTKNGKLVGIVSKTDLILALSRWQAD